MTLRIVDASEFETSAKHKVSRHEMKRRMALKASAISYYKRQVDKLTRQRKELLLENRRLVKMIDGVRAVLQEGGEK